MGVEGEIAGDQEWEKKRFLVKTATPTLPQNFSPCPPSSLRPPSALSH